MRTTTPHRFFLTLALFAALAAPFGQARGQWKLTSGPGGGQVNSIAAVDSLVFAGTYAGLFRSTDYGSSWKNCYSSSDINAVAVIGSYIFLGSGYQILYSTDRGLTWENSNFSPGSVQCFAGFDSIIFVGTSRGAYGLPGVYYSTDIGKTWNDISGTLEGCYGTSSIVLEGRNIFVGADCGGVYLSTDLGATWLARDTGLTSGDIISLGMANTSLFAATEWNGIFRSTDSGLTWISVTDTAMEPITAIISQKNNVCVSTRFDQVFSTSDNGETWKMLRQGYGQTDGSHLASNGSYLYLGPGDENGIGPYPFGGVYRSADSGKSWEPSNKGLAAVNVVLLTSIGSYIVAISDYGAVFRTSDEGDTWDFCDKAGVIHNSVVNDVPPSSILTAGSRLYVNVLGQSSVSDDSGVTWYALGGTPPELYIDSTLFCLGVDSGGIARSTDNGINWESCNRGLTLEYISQGKLGTEITYGVGALAGIGSNLLASALDGIYLSTNQGASWSGLSTPFGSFSSSCQINNKLIVSSSSAFFYSLDSGVTWAYLSSNGSGNGHTQLVSSGSELFWTNGGSTLISTDQGLSWTNTDSSSHLGHLGVNAILISGEYAVVGSYGVWRRPLSDFGISSVSQTPVAAQPSIQSFPNPFTQATQITLTTPAAGYAEVSIVNVLGAEVARLYAGELDAGNHSFTWDAGKNACPNGNYWCVVRMNGSVESLPMVLMP